MFDTTLLNKLKEGNRDAFNSIFRYYYPRVMSYVAAIVEEKVAEDIVQDVFLYVWENRRKLYVSAGFHSYLFQSAYTRCLDHFRKQESAGSYTAYVDLMNEYKKISEQDASVMDDLYSKDFYRLLYELLDKLPEQRREVFILTYINGMKAKEVAEEMRIPQRTVESHLYLALKFLKANLSRRDFFLLCLLVQEVGRC